MTNCKHDWQYQWKRELHAMVEKRDERIADLEDELAEMTLDRDYWRERAEASEQVVGEVVKELNTVYDQ